jgi:predicted amidohydrolase YtcJ
VQALQERYHSELLDFRVLKLSLDGTVEARTALLLEPWLGEEENTTQPLIPAQASADVVLQAARQNMDMHLHALGDGAVRLGLDMVERVRDEVPGSRSRFTMCHLQIVNPADVPRFGELDVIAQSTPSWYAFDDIALEYLGQERFEQMYPLRSIAAAGARLTFGSDYPATWIGLDGLNPLFNMEMAITRQPPGDPDFAVQPLAGERVTLAQAIRAYTLDAAWQLRLEEQVGSLEVGKQADLVVLSDNLFELDSYAIHKARVLFTMMDGRVFYTELAEAGR